MALSDYRADFPVSNLTFVLQFVLRKLRHDRDDAAGCLDFEILATLKSRSPEDGRRDNNGWLVFDGNSHG
jgi:hypothetical protein